MVDRFIYGVDIGGSFIKFAYFNQDLNLIREWQKATDTSNEGSNIIDDIASEIIENNQKYHISMSQVMGVGVGVPGPVNSDGFVERCVNLGWENVDLKDELTQKLSTLIEVGNDANVAALGEKEKGAGKNYKDVVMLTVGTGVGGGIVLKGDILNGTHGVSGEIGHLKVTSELDRQCNCGKYGCLEQYASATGIIKSTLDLAKVYQEHIPKALLEEKGTQLIFDLANDGYKSCIESTDKGAHYLSVAMAQIALIVDPEAFIIGGGVANSGDSYLSLVKKYYYQNAIFGSKNTEIVLAELGNHAGVYGCAALIKEK